MTMKTTTIAAGLVMGMVVGVLSFAAAEPQDQEAAAFVDVPADAFAGDALDESDADLSYATAAVDTSNTFVGVGAGARTAPPARDNTFLGFRAAYGPGMGSENTFTGSNAGYQNFAGSYNTFSGYKAGCSNTDGNYNTFFGHNAGYANSGPSEERPETGCDNTFLGASAGYSNDQGYWNTFTGFRAGYDNDGGYANTYAGWNAGCSNAFGSHNTFVGCSTGCDLADGEGNTFVGSLAGRHHVTGSHNTYIGTCAGAGNVSGGWNVCIGNWAGYEETGSYKLYIASNNTTPLIYGDFLAVRVGIGMTQPTETLDVNGTACVRAIPGGSGGTPVVVDAVGKLFRSSSSRRYKTDIETLTQDADKILDLRPVRFRWRSTGEPDIGLIAEDVETLAEDLVIRDAEGRPEAVKYDKLPLYLLLVIKDQQQRIETQQRRIETLEAANTRVESLQRRIDALEQTIGQASLPSQLTD
jgi:hypothetical protein